MQASHQEGKVPGNVCLETKETLLPGAGLDPEQQGAKGRKDTSPDVTSLQEPFRLSKEN